MEIIITGASGFVGQNLTKYLSQKNINTTPLSLRDKNWIDNIPNKSSAIIHLAGKAHDTTNTSKSEEYFEINTNLTKNLFDYFLKSDIKDFIFFSSVKATADTVNEILYETNESTPKTPYGLSKLKAEEYLLSKELPKNKRLFIIRPCMIHGPGNKGNLNLLYKVVKKGLPWPLADYHNKRSFLSIDNLNYLLFHILKDSNIESGIYNFSDDTPISTNELIEIIAEASGKKAKLWHIPKPLISCIAKTGDKIKLPLNSERLKKLTESYVVSNDKIKNSLKIKKLPICSKEGLYNTIKSFEE